MTASTIRVFAPTYAKSSTHAATKSPAYNTGAPGRAGKTSPTMPPTTRITAKIQSKMSIYILEATVAAIDDDRITGMACAGVAVKVDGYRIKISRNSPASL